MLDVGRNLAMNEGAQFGDVELTGAHIGGQLSLSQSRGAATLSMEHLYVEQDLLMDDGAVFKEVILRNARVEGQINLKRSRVYGTFDLEVLRAADVFLGPDAIFYGPVQLVFARIGGLWLAGSTFGSDLTGAQIDRDLLLGSSHAFSPRHTSARPAGAPRRRRAGRRDPTSCRRTTDVWAPEDRRAIKARAAIRRFVPGQHQARLSADEKAWPLVGASYRPPPAARA